VADEIDTTVTETTTEAAATVVDAPVVEADGAANEGTVLGSAAADEGDAGAAEDEGEGGGSDPKDGSDGDEAKPEGAPEAYELTAPEGMTLDAETLDLATPIFKELNLSNEQAQKLMPVAGEFAKRIQQAGQQQMLAEVATQRAAWGQEAKADPEIGGKNWDASVTTTAKALDTLGFEKGSPFRVLLEESGLGNHPEMIRAFVRVGKAVSEDSDFVRGNAGAQTESNPARLLYPNNPPKGA
jgi:hypothetical protein